MMRSLTCKGLDWGPVFMDTPIFLGFSDDLEALAATGHFIGSCASLPFGVRGFRIYGLDLGCND